MVKVSAGGPRLSAIHATTTTYLLHGLMEPGNDAVWREFDLRYRPIILGFARRSGLSETDAEEVTQDTMTRFLEEYRSGKYDRGRGRLRSWMIGILRYRIADLRRARARRQEVRGESALINLPDEQLEEVWASERRLVILRQAIQELRETTRTSEKTITAFERYVLRQQAAGAVAEELGMTVADVYMAKNRVAERLHDIIKRLEDLFDDR